MGLMSKPGASEFFLGHSCHLCLSVPITEVMESLLVEPVDWGSFRGRGAVDSRLMRSPSRSAVTEGEAYRFLFKLL